MSSWKAYRQAMQRAVKKHDTAAIKRTWREFEAFCEEHGWPDWWQDLQRAYFDVMVAEVYSV